MSDRELRQVLLDVISDIDSGRVRVPRRRGRGWRKTMGSAVLVTALGMGSAGLATGCDIRSVGQSVDGGADATARVDAGPAPAYGEPFLDAGPVLEYGEPFYDGGIQPAYAEPFVDAGSMEDYGVPPVWDAAIYPDGGGDVPAYGVPFCPPVPQDPEE